jgi:hypothetical protein
MVDRVIVGPQNTDVTKRIIDMTPKVATESDLTLPDGDFLQDIPKFAYNGRRHVGILLGFLKHSALKSGVWDTTYDNLPFKEKASRLFEVNDIRTVCDMGGGNDSKILRFIQPLVGDKVQFFCVDQGAGNGSRGGITYIEGDGRQLPKMISERQELAEIKKDGGFDTLLSNAVISPGGIDVPLVTRDEKSAITLVEGCVGALNAKPNSFALMTPFASVMAFKRSDIEPFSDVKYWTKEEYEGMDFCGILRWSMGWDCTAAILGRKHKR